MNIEELFRGVGLVIDDQILIEGSKDKIHKIVTDIESKGIPLAKYDHVPDLSIEHCKDFSFVLLDWELVVINDEQGFPIHGAKVLLEEAQKKLMDFIAQLIKTCYVPIFIFSNSSEDSINQVLVDNNILDVNVNSPIFIKSKSSLVTDTDSLVWPIIESWIRQSPAIYVCKKMQNSVKNAEVNMQREFAVIKYWPSVLWQTYMDDSIDPNNELMELLWQNTHVRLGRIEFNPDIVAYQEGEPLREDLQKVLSAQRFTTYVDDNTSMTGDFYRIKSGKYGVNIRPACDCVKRDDGEDLVYIIYGSEIKGDRLKTLFASEYGNFNERTNEAIVGPIADKMFVLFNFKKIEVMDVNDLKGKKLGRILPPFITHITERYGLYIQRQGLPRLPKEAVLTKEQLAAIENPAENNDSTDDISSILKRIRNNFCHG